jgi:hypothetical protein
MIIAKKPGKIKLTAALCLACYSEFSIRAEPVQGTHDETLWEGSSLDLEFSCAYWIHDDFW